MYEKIQETAHFLKERMTTSPETAIILGTGLARLASEIKVDLEINYSDIPNFPLSTVEGHSGKLLFGRLGSKDVMAMQGRFHYYEGYSMKEVTFPIRVMYELGIKNLFVSNARKNVPPGPRFPSMDSAYNKAFIAQAIEIATEKGIPVKQGVYLATQGPTFETPSEYRAFRVLGGDAVGMSTVPEVIVAVHCGIKVFGMSVITDIGFGEVIGEVSHEEVQKAADAVQPKMAEIFKALLEKI